MVIRVKILNNPNHINLIAQSEGYYRHSDIHDYHLPSEIEERVNSIVTHMHSQYRDYSNAAINTTRAFETLLDELKNVACCLKKSIETRGMNPAQVFYEIDADRSVGILNILWHSISFTTRNNTKPQALARENAPPLFSGRIIALNGDFQDAALEIQDQEFPDILRCEIASMYIPHNFSEPAIIKIKPLEDKEIYYPQDEAPGEFLLKIIEIVCGGGIFHENAPEDD
jgi:hypothetical protein